MWLLLAFVGITWRDGCLGRETLTESRARFREGPGCGVHIHFCDGGVVELRRCKTLDRAMGRGMCRDPDDCCI